MNEVDVAVFRAIHQAFSGAWALPMAALSTVGGGWGALAIVPLLARERTRRFARSLALVLGATAILVFILQAARRPRAPCACLPDVHARVLAAPTDFSFPSGHAAGSFAFAVFVAVVIVRALPEEGPRPQRLGRWSAAAALLLLAGVALSRIALGVHFPGDVVAGAIVGATVGRIGAHLHLAAALDRPL